MGKIYQGRYTAGVAAGMKMKELIKEGVITEQQAKIGYVAAYPYAEVISGYTAFLLGVRSVVPDAVMTVRYTNKWNDYRTEKKYAKDLIDEGCVIDVYKRQPGSNDHDVCFFYNGWHICSFRVTDSYGCIFLKQHHGGWFSNDGTSADHDSFFTGAVDAIVI